MVAGLDGSVMNPRIALDLVRVESEYYVHGQVSLRDDRGVANPLLLTTRKRHTLEAVRRLLRWVIYDVVRFFLAFSFFAYGLSKLLDLQFAWGYEQFDRPIRRLGGMGLVWAFFAYSRPYQICIGLAEVLPAALLLTKRTAVLGMLLYLPVITNVVLVDLCYSVERGATMTSIVLLAGNLLMLWLRRKRLLAVLNILMQRSLDQAESAAGGGKPTQTTSV